MEGRQTIYIASLKEPELLLPDEHTVLDAAETFPVDGMIEAPKPTGFEPKVARAHVAKRAIIGYARQSRR